MILLYHIVSALASLLVAPCFAIASLSGKHKAANLLQHFGCVPEFEKDTRTLWLHALSMGEVTAAVPILKTIHHTRPELRIVVSVTTDSGYEAAKKNLPFAASVFFHPLDCLPFTALALSRIQPDLFIAMDTGLWPGFLNLLKRKSIPAMLLNGRMSKKSLRRYGTLGFIMKDALDSFSLIVMQSEAGVQSLRELGITAEKLQTSGNPKLDGLKSLPGPARAQLKESFRIPAGSPVWVAGSTHEGEDEMILDAYVKLREKHRGLVLILAPRRMERVESVCGLLRERKIPFEKRSQITPASPLNHDVILLDTLGQLADVYAIGEIAFVGRSLIAPGGGHSLTEPVAQGKSVLHGPYVDNEQHNADDLRTAGLAFEVKTAQEMEAALNKLLSDPARLAQIADKTRIWLNARQGASQKLAALILEKLKD